jgi:L-malate glycosyltransferase
LGIGILSFPTLGGSGMVATRLAMELSNRGHDIHYISYKKPFGLVKHQPNLTLHEVKVSNYSLFREIGSLYTINLSNFIKKVVQEQNLSIVNSHYGIPHAVSCYLAKQMIDFKSIVSLHGSDVHLFGDDEAFHDIMSHVLQNTDMLTTVSDYLADLSYKTFKLKTKPLVIYDFIDTNEFKPLGIEREKVIVHASNFRDIKRVPFLVNIFAKIAKDFPDWKLKLIGDGPDRITVARQVREYGIRDQVIFVDPHMDIPREFAEASILATPSKIESFGLTIGEGMACETPIWATNTGGIPEVCVDGETGFLFDPNDYEQAEEKLRHLMSDEHLRVEMGRKGRQFIKAKFDIKKIVDQYECLFKC